MKSSISDNILIYYKENIINTITAYILNFFNFFVYKLKFLTL